MSAPILRQIQSRLVAAVCAGAIAAPIFLFASPVAAADDLDPVLLAGMEARAIGPATMSGRVAAVTGNPGRPERVWVGAATGGVWRSDDSGVTWSPVFDDQPVASIGAIGISPANPDRIWVGTGEGNPRNSASVGNGIYLSDDGGESWRHLGLATSERIHRILPHPRDPDTAFACAMGPTWGEGGERGVYRTRDGGDTWQPVLTATREAARPTTGCADLELDPANPDHLVAALWDHRRWPWFFRSGGAGSGLFVSRDGGDTWREATAADGLPEGPLGRIGLGLAPSRPDTVYAFVEAETNGVYRSSDGGDTWELRSEEPAAGPGSSGLHTGGHKPSVNMGRTVAGDNLMGKGITRTAFAAEWRRRAREGNDDRYRAIQPRPPCAVRLPGQHLPLAHR